MYEAIVQQFFANMSAYWTKQAGRATTARALAQAGNYKADNLASDLAGSWFDTVDAWTTFPPVFGSPLLPVAFTTALHNAAAPQPATAFVPATVPDGAVAIAELVNTAKITGPVFNPAPAVAGGQLTVSLQFVGGEVAGQYIGLALRATTPVAFVCIVLT